MERFFVSVRHGDLAAVTQLLEEQPGLVRAVRTRGPQKDRGQQPLGIAIKTRHYDIARLLLEAGADVNFVEAEGTTDGMRQAVVEDAVESAVATGIGPAADRRQHAEALALLRDMIARGAVVDTINPSHGRPGLAWFAERVMHYGRRGLDRRSVDVVTRIAQVLVDAGADPGRAYVLRLFRQGGELIEERRTTLRAELVNGGPPFSRPPADQLVDILDACVARSAERDRTPPRRWWRRP